MSASPRNARQQAAGQTVANKLLEIKVVNFRLEESYKLTAGWASPVYIDCRKLTSFPGARRKVTELARLEIEDNIGHESLDAVAGGETAGIPYAAWISDALMLPMQYVCKKLKGFGRDPQIEGDVRDGQRVILVEDLAAAETAGHFTPASIAGVKEFLKNPVAWSVAHGGKGA